MSDTPSRHPSRKEIEAFLADTLPSDAEEQVNRHVEECAACERLMAELAGKDTIGELAAIPIRAAAPSASRSQPQFPPLIPGYEILGSIGRGGMGIVWKARQVTPDRIVAVKTIRAELEGEAKIVRRFRWETKIVAQLRHPYIVQLYEADECDGVHFFSMEYCEGGSLADRFDSKPVSASETAELIEKVALAAHAAHEAGVVHRDLKPANVLMQDGEPRISDFGLASSSQDASRVTQHGDALGTPAYMPPEQLRGQLHALGAATDVYSIGVMMYECLTGRQPFVGSGHEVMLQALNDQPVPLRRLHATVPIDMQTICLKCLEKEPERRYTSAAALADDLRRWRNNHPISARPTTPVEKIWLWARREPAQAAAMLMLLLVLFLGSVAGTITHLWLETSRARSRLKEANIDLVEANRTNEHLIYVNELWRAQQSLQGSEYGAMGEHLARCPSHLRGWEWDYLNSQCRLKRSLKEIGGSVTRVAVSPHGKFVAIGDDDGEVQLWEVGVSDKPITFNRHEGTVRGIAFSPCGRLLASVGDDGRLTVRSLADRKVVHEDDHGAKLRAVCFSPDGLLLTTAGFDEKIHIRDTENWVERDCLTYDVPDRNGNRDDNVLATSFHPWKPHLAAAYGGGHMAVWDISESSEPRRISPDSFAHHSAVHDISYSIDGKTLLTVCQFKDQDNPGTLCLWDAKSFHVRHNVEQADDVNQAKFSADGKLIATCGDDSTVRIYYATTLREAKVLRGHLGDANSVCFSPKGTRVISGGDDSGRGVVHLWNGKPEEAPVQDGKIRASAVAFSKLGAFTAKGTDGNQIIVQNARGRETPMLALDSYGEINSLSLSTDGLRVAAVTDHVKVTIWDTASDESRSFEWPERTLPAIARSERTSHFAHVAESSSVAVSANGQWVAYCCDDSVVRLLRAPKFREPRVLQGHRDVVSCLALSPNSRWLATGSYDRDIIIWDVDSGKKLQRLKGHNDFVRSVCFSADGSQLASGSEDFSIRVWDTGTGEQTSHLIGHTGYVTGLSISPDGTRLASTGPADLVMLWDLARGELVITLESGLSDSTDVMFSPDGQTLAVSGRNGAVRLLSVSDEVTGIQGN